MGWLKYGTITLLILLVGAALVLYKGDLPAELVDEKYSNEHSQFLFLPSGSRIHYRDQGNREAPAMVLVHGSNASLHTWEPWVKELGAHFRIITLDLPGHGLTGQVPGDDYSSEAQVSTVGALVEFLDVPTFILGGNSMGGGVTWRYALAHPDQVSAMILVDASAPRHWRMDLAAKKSGTDQERETPLAFKLLGEPWFRAIARYLDPYQLTAQGVRSAYNQSNVVNDALIDRYYELSIREGTREATLKRFGQRRDIDGPRIDLSVLKQPTLVMWGRQDSLIDVALAYRFDEVLPNSQLVIFDEVGHIPMEEVPRRSAAAVLAFTRTFEQNADRIPDQTPYQTPDQTPYQTPDQTPEQTETPTLDTPSVEKGSAP